MPGSSRTLHEDQIFRIDHFLGKDTVQSIMAFRFANGLFEPSGTATASITCRYRDRNVGVEPAARSYEATGALRDMVPNMCRLLTMVAGAADLLRRQSHPARRRPTYWTPCPLKPARRARPIRPRRRAGKPVKAYRDRAEVAPDSNVETYVAMELAIDTGGGPACRSTCAPASTWRSA